MLIVPMHIKLSPKQYEDLEDMKNKTCTDKSVIVRGLINIAIEKFKEGERIWESN
jgi:predicted DNA-binding protein